MAIAEASMPKAGNFSTADPAAVDAAIARVLQSEREARDAVNQCAREAEAISERAQQQAREIARRAAQRAVRVQRWSAERLQRELARLDQQQEPDPAGAAHSDVPLRLRRVAERLAADLTGGP